MTIFSLVIVNKLVFYFVVILSTPNLYALNGVFIKTHNHDIKLIISLLPIKITIITLKIFLMYKV